MNHSSKLCVISFKECWQDHGGNWRTQGGFPGQIRAVASLFEETTILITEVPPLPSGDPLPEQAIVTPLPKPRGQDLHRKFFFLLLLPSLCYRLLRAIRNADVVHTPLPGDIPLLGLLLALIIRKRVIVRYCGSWQSNTQSTLMNRVTKRLMLAFAGGRNVMFATGHASTPPAHNIPWIFATALHEQDLVNSDAISLEPPKNYRFLYVGRLSPEKGVRVLLSACEHLRSTSSIPNGFELAIAGDGIQREQLEKIAGNLLPDLKVSFLGHLGRNRLLEEIDSAYLCVQPSLTEGFSKAWLDSMARGKPLIVTRVGAAEHVVGTKGERGWLVEPGNPQALAKAILAAIAADETYRDKSRNCWEFASGRTLGAWATEISKAATRAWNTDLGADGKIRF